MNVRWLNQREWEKVTRFRIHKMINTLHRVHDWALVKNGFSEFAGEAVKIVAFFVFEVRNCCIETKWGHISNAHANSYFKMQNLRLVSMRLVYSGTSALQWNFFLCLKTHFWKEVSKKMQRRNILRCNEEVNAFERWNYVCERVWSPPPPLPLQSNPNS